MPDANTTARQRQASASTTTTATLGGNVKIAAALSQAATAASATSATAPTITTPAVPNTTVAATNTTGYDVTVYVTGGTITEIDVNGTNTGLTAGTFRVANGGTIKLTYTGSPTWVWMLAEAVPQVPAGYVDVLIGSTVYKMPFYQV